MAVTKGYRQSPAHVRRRIDARVATLAAKPRPVSSEWLTREYVESGRSCVEIGLELGKDPKTIWAWLRFYGIPTRPRGAHAEHHFKKGERSGFAGRKHSDVSKKRIRQASIADGRVPYLKDGAHWLAGKTGPDHPSWKGGITPARQAFYGTAEWCEAVKAVWARADAECERCGLDHRSVRDARGDGSFHVHHVESFAVVELRAEVTNLRLLCVDCHRFVHSRRNVGRELLGER